MTFAYATLLHGEDYVAGALTLGNTIKEFGSDAALAILIDKASLTEKLVSLINAVYTDVIDISDSLVQAPVEHVALKLGRDELAITFSKILLWKLKYDHVVFLDLDTLPLKPLDGLFEEFKDISTREIVASPDVGWPDLFNLGVLLIKPLEAVFSELLEFAKEHSAFDGADQGLLNEFFTLSNGKYSWTRLPYLYNVTPTPHYQYVPALERFKDNVKLVHFIGAGKPWQARYESDDQFRQLWWSKFDKFYPDESDRIHILLRPGEAHSLRFNKLENVWDKTEIPALEELAIEEPTPPKKVFPWEERERVSPTRVWEPVDYGKDAPRTRERRVSLEGTEAKILLVGTGRSLRRASNQFNDELRFNPDKSLEEVSKMPLMFLAKKKKDESKEAK